MSEGLHCELFPAGGVSGRFGDRGALLPPLEEGALKEFFAEMTKTQLAYRKGKQEDQEATIGLRIEQFQAKNERPSQCRHPENENH